MEYTPIPVVVSGEDSEWHLHVKDVYDFAYEIAFEFDKIVNVQGIEEVRPIINKVVNVLELLEASVNKIESLEKEIGELKFNSLQLSSEKTFHEQEKSRLKQAYEELEDAWVQESANLKASISKLKTENKLMQSFIAKGREVLETADSYKVILEDQENFISKLKSALKQRENQLEKDASELEALKCTIEKLSDTNKSLHQELQGTKNIIKMLSLQKMEYETKLNIQDRKLTSLQQTLPDSANKVHKDEDHVKCTSIASSDTDDFKFSSDANTVHSLLQEQRDLKHKIKSLEIELQSTKHQVQKYESTVLKLTKEQKDRQIQKTSTVRQLFHLFLGVVTICP
ncbi:RILP-like protein-like protein, partial [Stegodyphus mimosarum]